MLDKLSFFQAERAKINLLQRSFIFALSLAVIYGVIANLDFMSHGLAMATIMIVGSAWLLWRFVRERKDLYAAAFELDRRGTKPDLFPTVLELELGEDKKCSVLLLDSANEEFSRRVSSKDFLNFRDHLRTPLMIILFLLIGPLLSILDFGDESSQSPDQATYQGPEKISDQTPDKISDKGAGGPQGANGKEKQTPISQGKDQDKAQGQGKDQDQSKAQSQGKDQGQGKDQDQSKAQGQGKDEGQDQGQGKDQGQSKAQSQDKDQGQGQGQGKDQGQDQGQDQGKDQDQSKAQGKDQGQGQGKAQGQGQGKDQGQGEAQGQSQDLGQSLDSSDSKFGKQNGSNGIGQGVLNPGDPTPLPKDANTPRKRSLTSFERTRLKVDEQKADYDPKVHGFPGGGSFDWTKIQSQELKNQEYQKGRDILEGFLADQRVPGAYKANIIRFLNSVEPVEQP